MLDRQSARQRLDIACQGRAAQKLKHVGVGWSHPINYAPLAVIVSQNRTLRLLNKGPCCSSNICLLFIQGWPTGAYL